MDFNFGITGTEQLEGINVSESDSALFSSNPEDVKPQPEEVEEKKPEEKATPKKTNFVDAGPIGFEADQKSPLFDNDEDEEEGEEPEVGLDMPVQEEQEEVAEEGDEEELEDSDNTFASLSNDLLSLGIFTQTENDETIETPEQFKARWEYEKKLGAQQELSNFLSQFGQEHIDAFNAIYVNGVKPDIYFKSQAEIIDFEGANIDDEFVQEKVVKSYYQDLGWKEERIAKKIEKLRDYDDLKEEAETAKEKLVEKKKFQLQQVEEQSKAAVQAKAQQKQLYVQGIQQTLSEKIQEKSFDGIPVSQELAAQVYDSMTREKWVLPNGEKLSDFDKFLLDLKRPENVALASKVALLMTNNFDFSSIKKEAISKESTELFKSINSKQKVSKRNKAASSAKVFNF